MSQPPHPNYPPHPPQGYYPPPPQDYNYPPQGYYPPPPPPHPQYGYYDQQYQGYPPQQQYYGGPPPQADEQQNNEVPQDIPVQRNGNQVETEQPQQNDQQQQIVPQLEQQQKEDENLEQLRNNLNKEIEKLLFYLNDPNGSKPLHQILRETCDKLKKNILYDYVPNPNEKNSHLCYTYINNDLYGQGSGKSKKDSRSDSAKDASLKLLNESPEALAYFRLETEKELDKRAQLGVVSQQYPEQAQQQQPQQLQQPQQKQQPQQQQVPPHQYSNPSQQQTAEQQQQQQMQQSVQLLPEHRQENLPDYDSTKNYKNDLNEYAHKFLRKQIKYEQYLQNNEWVVICQVAQLSEKGVARTTKDAKNIAAYRLLIRARDLENMEPGILGGGEEAIKAKKEKKMLKNQKNKNKRNKLPDGEDALEGEQMIQKKIKTNQELIQENLNQNKETQLEQLDQRFIDFSKFENPFEEQEIKLKQFLQNLATKLTPNQHQLQHAQELVQELVSHGVQMKEIGVLSFISVGSYPSKTLMANNLTIDLVANFSITDLNLTEEQRYQESSKILKEFLDQSLKKPFDEQNQEQQQQFKTNERVFLDNNSKCIFVHSLQNPQIKLKIQFSFVADKYHAAVHNRIWMNRFGNLEDYQNIQSLMRILRHFRAKHSLQIPTEILDFALYAVTNKYKFGDYVRSIIGFFEFVGNEGLQKIVEENNKNNIEIFKHQLETLKKAFSAQNRPGIIRFQQLCLETYQKGNYEEILAFEAE